jgi:hypothetical protein
MSSAISPKIQQKIQHWKERLAGVRGDNALLNFNTGKKKSIKFLMPSSELFQELVTKERSIKITDQETEPTGADRIAILKKLYRNANEVQRQKGVNCLFVAIGTLSWKLKSGSKAQISSPVFLVPVDLRKVKKRDEYILTAIDEDFLLNPVLVHALNNEYGINLRDVFMDQLLNCDDLLAQVNEDINEQKTWKIESTAHLALFERPKAAMLKDLEQCADKIAKHPILMGFANDLSAYEPQNFDISDPKILDSYHPKSFFQVLDADSSQQVVIETAKQGLSFITQGPPGTGKSQTITNIIVELIAQKKRVLLVAEKPGALEVVAKKLRQCGLGSLCLGLHEKETASKKGFSRSLKETADFLEQYHEFQISDSFFEDLRSDRKIINQHPVQLHQTWKPIEKSAFELYGDLLRFDREEIPLVKFSISDIEQWSVAHLRSVKQKLEELERFDCFFREEKTTLWINSRYSLTSSKERAELETAITNLRRGIDLTNKIANRTYQLLNLPQPTFQHDIEEWETAIMYVINQPHILPQEWSRINLIDLQCSYAELKEKNIKIAEKLESLRKKYSSAIQNLDIIGILQTARQRYGNLLRLFKKGYWKVHRTVFLCRREQSKFSFWFSFLFGYSQLVLDLQQILDYKQLCAEIKDDDYLAFFPFYSQNKTKVDLNAITLSLTWIEGLQSYSLKKDQVATVVSNRDLTTELANLLTELKTARVLIMQGFDFLRNCFPNVERLITGSNQPLNQTNLNKIRAFLDDAETELDIFRDWIRYQTCLTDLKKMGAEAFIDSLKETTIIPDLWYRSLQAAVYKRWLTYIYDESADLNDFNVKTHERRIDEFSQRDIEQYKIAQKRLQQMHAHQWQSWSTQPGSKEKLSILNREAVKQQKHKSVREFINETEDLVLVLKPCWMMSPLAVSEYIDPQIPNFDVVIFDEASQILTEESVSAIMRAKQVIVVGDDKQLPPTFSFNKFDADDDNSGDDENCESLLVECSRFMKNFTLQWHYRSQDESLIAFSNEHFYNSKLVTFPNPTKDITRGVHFHYVENGIYDRGGKTINIHEAEEVAKLALEHAKTSQQTLGIIAFSKNQANAIQKELDRLSTKNSELGELLEDSDKFFLRHLESVQGEQRDVIILSFCYGLDQEGKMLYNFGPITNSTNGERRLNVAITRAVQKLILVASIHGSDLQTEGKSESIKKLQSYLNYAERNSIQVEFQPDDSSRLSSTPCKDAIIEDICFALQKAGYGTCSSVGQSNSPIDLAIFDQQEPHKFILGIELDGVNYQAQNTARDRDRIRPKVLGDLKWEIYRIWSKEWFHNRDNQIKCLIEHLETKTINI